MVTRLPVKSNKTKVQHRFFNYLFIENKGYTFLQKRTSKDVWQNLYEFPLIESDHLLSSTELFESEIFNQLFHTISEVEISKLSNPMKHILTHRVIMAQFVSIKISNENDALNNYIKVPFGKIEQYAVSRLMELFIEKLEI
jgi:A/G-specific adenine glycosylase